MVQKFTQWLSRQQERRREQHQRLIENIAHRLYLNRVARNREGDEETDLAKAKQLARNPFTRTAFRFGAYWRGRVDSFESTWVEAALEGLANDLQNLAIIDLLNVVASLSLISTAIGFFSEADERKQQRQTQAWQLITSAVGQRHEAGRKVAIEALYADGVPLDGLDINKAQINKLDLSPRCFLLGWHVPDRVCGFKQQIFPQQEEPSNSEYQEKEVKLPMIISEKTVYFRKINFQDVELRNSNFQKAKFWLSNLQEGQIVYSNFQEADLSQNNFQKGLFRNCDFQKANLSNSDFQKALLISNNLQGAVLSDTDLDNALLIDMDLRTVTGLVQDQLEGDNHPLICNTLVPEEFGIDKDRDCDNLAQALLETFPKPEYRDGFSSLEEAQERLQSLREAAKSANEED